MSFISPDEPALQVGIEVVNAVSRSVALEWARGSEDVCVGGLYRVCRQARHRQIDRAAFSRRQHRAVLQLGHEVQYFVAMLLAAMPFIWVGRARLLNRSRCATSRGC